jgi:pyruvate dehydrogenase E2 component (dihydrolipoamide acetyltransferase)
MPSTVPSDGEPMSSVKEFKLPDLGEGLTEGEILKWLVAEGDMVTQNQPIVEVETAKAAVEIPAKWAGRVAKIFHAEGTTVEVGMPIIAIDTDPSGSAPASSSASDLPTPSAASLAAVEVAPAEGMVEPGLIGGPAPGGRTAVLVGYGPRTTSAARRPRKSTTAPGPAASGLTSEERARREDSALEAPVPRASEASADIRAKPPVRKLARDLGVDLADLVGSGPQGSITREDVQAAVSGSARPKAAAQFGPDREERIPIKGVRKLMAENMVASAFTAPHVTEFLTVDATRAMRAVDRLRELPDWQGVRVSPLLLVAKAVLIAVQRHPLVNSTWSAETAEIIVKEYVNLGIAAATPRGLIVPNIKDAGRLSLRELADALTDLVTAAKDGRTAPADMAGGTLTITNVGVFGVDSGTPILPPGESAILAIGSIRPAPWVHKGRIRVRQVATLALSFDHRIIDGELGSAFLRDVGAFLADPQTSLLSWS